MKSTHAAWDALIGLEKLTLDAGPAPADYTVGGTLTGGTSGKTSVVVAKLSSTVYLIKDRNGAYTDGEIISDGTNSRDCGAGYPVLSNENVVGLVADDSSLPSFIRNKLDSIQQRALLNSSYKLTKREAALIARALIALGENQPRDGGPA
jgi:hypothetical protein